MLAADETTPVELNPIHLSRQPSKVDSAQLEKLNAVKYEFVGGEILPLTVGKCYPSPVQVMVAEELCRLLNAKIAHDGRWRTVWTEPTPTHWCKVERMFRPWHPTILECQYLDKDGDIWCVVTIDDDAFQVVEDGITNYVDKCEEAYQFVYKLLHKVVEVKHDQTRRVAQGEALTPTDWLPPATGAL